MAGANEPIRSHQNPPPVTEGLDPQVDSAIDQAVERGELDIIGDLAYPLMLGLNCRDILGIPQRDWHRNFKQWAENMFLVADLDITPLTYERGMLAISGLAEFLSRQLFPKSCAMTVPSRGSHARRRAMSSWRIQAFIEAREWFASSGRRIEILPGFPSPTNSISADTYPNWWRRLPWAH